MLHNVFRAEPDPIVGIVISMVLGAALVSGVAIALGKLSGKPLRGRRLLLSVAIALGLTISGLVLNFFTPPNSFGGIVTVVAVPLMPGVFVMNVFGRHSLDDLPFFGGFALNVLILSTCAYTVLRRTQRA
jgi:hypothetical protein